jgi:hypothetical protein
MYTYTSFVASLLISCEEQISAYYLAVRLSTIAAGRVVFHVTQRGTWRPCDCMTSLGIGTCGEAWKQPSAPLQGSACCACVRVCPIGDFCGFTVEKYDSVCSLNIHNGIFGWLTYYLMFMYREDNDGIVDVLGRFAIGESACELRKVGSKTRRRLISIRIIIH